MTVAPAEFAATSRFAQAGDLRLHYHEAGPADWGAAPGTPAGPGNPGKKAFVYERPTLPDRKPKLPNNWAGKQDKKPKK